MTQKISIIIVNFNTAQYVHKCIQSVLEHTNNINFEIILVDNQSTERDIEQVTVQYPHIQFIQSPQNVGFGSACNLAAEQATGQFLFFLNPDTILKNNALKCFLDFWNLNEKKYKVSCLGAVLYNEAGQAIHSFEVFPSMKVYIANKVKSITAKLVGKSFNIPLLRMPPNTESIAVDYVTGANLFISKENFDIENGYCSDFFLYFEETDLQFRLYKRGMQAMLINTPIIQHIGGASTLNNKPMQRVYYSDSLLTYFKKHSNILLFQIFKCCWLLLDFRTFIQKITLLKNKNN